MKYLKVKDDNTLVRDTDSGAILVSSDNEYNNFLKKRQLSLNNQKIILEQSKEINQLKNELNEIKGLLKTLVKVSSDANNL